MQVFYHNLYEYQKGLRNLALCTEKNDNLIPILKRLKKEKVHYVVHRVQEKFNIYFGDIESIGIIKTFKTPMLNKLSDEQDFMLGIMLGYSRIKQCKRYLDRKANPIKIVS